MLLFLFRFLQIYPEYSESGTTILLDDVVKELGKINFFYTCEICLSYHIIV